MTPNEPGVLAHRHSGRSSSCSSHYGVPATRPQLPSHRKDPPDLRHHDDEEEDLTYKVPLISNDLICSDVNAHYKRTATHVNVCK